jgi:hypothetical protein
VVVVVEEEEEEEKEREEEEEMLVLKRRKEYACIIVGQGSVSVEISANINIFIYHKNRKMIFFVVLKNSCFFLNYKHKFIFLMPLNAPRCEITLS